MEKILKSIGLIFVMMAVLILIIAVIMRSNTNIYFIVSGVLLIAGIITHVVLNKKFM